jgi:hypothetical protein
MISVVTFQIETPNALGAEIKEEDNGLKATV